MTPDEERRPVPADPFAREVIALFGLPFDLDGMDAAARRVLRAASAPERLMLSTVNLDWLVQAARDPAFRQSALDSDMVTMDGVPVVLLARMAGAGTASKVAGSDLFERLRGEDLSVFFFGGREGAAARAAAVLDGAAGAMRAVGHHNPGFGDVAAMSAPEHLAPIQAAAPDLLVVSLGAVKGQAWLMANAARLPTPVITHLGAVVDFTAGTVDRAPALLQRTGLEWAWRVGQDPVLWRRYAGDARALPRLILHARTVRRLVRALRREAAVGAARFAEGTLTVEGAAGSAVVRDAARDAAAADGPVRIELAPGAAPDLAALGQLLLLRAALARAGRRHALCTRDAKAARLAHLTLGDAPSPSAAGGGEGAPDGTVGL